MNYWLMKSEPNEFGIDDLRARKNRVEPWDGVRNYQARNMMRDEMKKDDLIFFYHSNCDEPGIVGIMNVHREGYPDPTALDAKDKHFDPKSERENPRWFLVNVKFVRKLKRTITLSELKERPDLDGFALVRRGNRLSVLPVSEAHWNSILAIE